jgi:hypothetical protein
MMTRFGWMLMIDRDRGKVCQPRQSALVGSGEPHFMVDVLP